MVLVINYDKKAFRGLRLFLYPISLTFRDCNFTGKNARRGTGDRKYFLISLYVNIFIISI